MKRLTPPFLLAARRAVRLLRPSPGAALAPVESMVPLPGGYVVAAYAAPAPGRGRFVAYAKAFRGPAASYWQVAGCFAKFAGESEHESAAGALADAVGVALMSLMNVGCLPPRNACPCGDIPCA
jgi:hypothetical protein